MFRLWRNSLILMLVLITLISPVGAAPRAPNTPGDLDPTFAGFGAGGITTITETNDVYGMALQPGGKIVIAGYKGSNESNIVVMRHQSNGVLDTTFAGDGSATVSYPGFAIRAYVVAVQRDGKIVVVGNIFSNPSSFLVARLTKAGALDPSFGDGGFVITDFDSNVDAAEAVVIQPDGKIVVAGIAKIGDDEDFAVARYNPNGGLDSSFGGDGKVTIGFGGEDDARDIALQDDGKLVLAGSSGQGFFLDYDFAVARLNVNGSLDNSFDGDGKLTTGFGDTDHAEAVAIQTDGKIVAAGGNDVARYLPNGALDSSFDGDGKYSVASSDDLSDLVAQPDGKIVLLGYHMSLDNTFKFSFWRLNPNASPDTSFDGDGDAFLDLGSSGGGTDLALQPDGRLLALGQVGNNRVLLRLWPDATSDTGGQQTFGIADSLFGLGSDEQADGMAIQSDGKIVVAGRVDDPANTDSNLLLVRFLSGGQPDASFGDQGRVIFSVGQFEAATAVALQPDGKIVVAGYADPSGSVESNFLVARYNPDGTKDDTFGFFGFNIVDFLGSTDRGFAVALAPDGKVVVAGSVWNGSRNVIGVARFTSDGILDTTFDGDGKVITQWVQQFNSVSAVVVELDGQIVVGGQAGEDFGLLRLATNGPGWLFRLAGCNAHRHGRHRLPLRAGAGP